MVTKPKGLPKTGGRKKSWGLAGTLREELVKNDFNIMKEFIKAYKDDCNAEFSMPFKRCEVLIKFMEFIYPKPKLDVGLSFTPQQALDIVNKLIEEHEPDTRTVEPIPDSTR